MNMDTYEALHREIYNEIYGKLERKDRETLRFAPVGTAEQVLHADKLRRFFLSLHQPDDAALELDQQRGHSERAVEKYVARVTERKLHRFLAILIIAGCSITAARAAVVKLVAADTWPIAGSKGRSICSLPVAREELDAIFSQDGIAADKFLGKQAYFCPVILRENEEVRLEEIDYRRLPYLEEHSIGKGSFGHVFSVKIAKGHFYDPTKQSANLKPQEIARKDYELSRDALVERETMKKILSSSSRECPNIVKTIGSLELGSSVYSLFMPKAICDLRAYMIEHHQARPNSIKERKDLVRCAVGLAGGLNFLHNEMKTPEMEDLVCYHLDLKPSNILIFMEKDPQDSQMRNIWKLSDFGMSRVKIKTSGEGVAREKDVNSWFVRRSQQEDQSASATRNARGDGTYLAPESTASGRAMRASSDVWSLGCVLSVLFCYMDGGRDRVIQYAEERMMHDDALGCDTFFLPSRRFRPAKLSPVVHRTHTHLIRGAAERSPREGEIVDFALRYIEKLVLEVDQFKRSGARQVMTMLENTFRAYQKLDQDEPQPPHLGLSTRPSSPGVGRPRHGILPSIFTAKEHDTGDRNIHSWYLSEAEALKGCQISPDCSFIAYWTDRKISLFSAHSPLSTRGTTLEPEAEYTLEEENCFWKTIRLTSKYLVASTTKVTFLCYIFDLEHSNFDNLYMIEPPLSAISKLAISPDSRTLACVLRASEDARKPGSLFVGSVLDLIRMEAYRPGSSPSAHSQEPPTSPSQVTAVNCWWKYPLKWPAENVTKLSFSTTDDLYFVVLPELGTHNRDHKVSLVHVNVLGRDLHILHLDSRGLDSTARLLTTFAPFYRKIATCAVVTRERELYIHDMATESPTIPIRKDIKNYRVLKLMMATSDDKIFSLARKSANHRMMLIEMKVPRSGSDELCVRELAYLPSLSEDDQLTERLYDIDGEKGVIIAALVGKGRRAILRVGVDGAETMSSPNR
ncbi:kinase-like domain-containing protein [Aspergillus pseudoustus]|uniref:Kinase-like domain-containing protein n=1 Tax=Aspergillus pseudoustus TaxID=1810923 RepID=A0ABR4JPB4_9EURO